MPHRCCVPNCNLGYTYKPGCEEKVKMFSTNDVKMQQKWTKLIPRKNYQVTRYSYVCVKHFADEDIDKGKKIVVGGKEDLIPYTKWVLKKGAVSKLFLSKYCTSSLLSCSNCITNSFIAFLITEGPAEKKPCNESLNYSTPSNNKRKVSVNSKENISLPKKKGV